MKHITMKTPIQQLKENYYKMSESEFHYWMSQNIDTLMKEECNIIMKAYDRDVINGIQNWFIRDGERYYELHMEGKSGIREYSSGNKAYTMENTSAEIEVDPDKVVSIPPKLNKGFFLDYSFEDGV
jgi:hypothetical protein